LRGNTANVPMKLRKATPPVNKALFFVGYGDDNCSYGAKMGQGFGKP
jgi:hypothetical protein